MGVDSHCWAGVDVGGARKGFHLALVDGAARVLVGGERIATAAEVVERLLPLSPALVAVDAPRRPAGSGERSRACERAFTRAHICALRYTPDLEEIRANPFHDWVLRGLELFRALEDAGLAGIECFPTAAWTVWGGPRGGTPRATWSARTLAWLGVTDASRRLGQDARDAIAAALTARLHHLGRTRAFNELVVPATGSARDLTRRPRLARELTSAAASGAPRR